MKQQFCSNCGADVFIIKNGYKVCKYCNTRYDLDDTDRPPKKAEVSILSDIDILLQKCKDDPLHAKKYANLVLDIDPTNREAKKYL